MRVLVACEYSNTVRDAFLREGHDAYSCDLVRADPSPNWRRHFRCDVRPLLRERWDLVVAHPPCTYLSVMSGCLLVAGLPLEEQPRELGILQGASLFWDCYNANSERVCVENPMPNVLARRLLPLWTQVVQPYQFGDPWLKKTCLWLRNLPPLEPTLVVEPAYKLVESGNRRRTPKMGKSSTDRSRTFPGIARAMAEQWGRL